MPHFLIKKEDIKNNILTLDSDKYNDDFFHLSRVLRIKTGDLIKFIDEFKIVYFCKIIEITKRFLKAEVLKTEKSNRFLKTNICLIQSVLMNDAQNLAIANAVQTGVREIYPVISDNVSVSKKALDGKQEKWQKIALENFKQCERADLAQIHPVSSLMEALLKFERDNIIIFAEKNVNKKLDEVLNKIDVNNKIAIVIGPEGGFSNAEFEYFIQNNYNLITLGKMIYKAPNAVTAGVSNVVLRLDEV